MKAAALLLLLLVPPAAAQTVPPLTGRVVDTADMLSPQTEAAITARLAAFEDSTTTQIAVLTVPSLGGGNLEAFATKVFRTWALGQDGRDNGALLLIARDDRTLRIEVGYGLEGDLTDARAATIVRDEIVPRLRDNDPDAAVSVGVDAMIAIVSGTYRAAAGFRDAPSGGSDLDPVGRALFGILFAGIPLIMLLMMLNLGVGDTFYMSAISGFLGLFITIGATVATGNLYLISLVVIIPLVSVLLDGFLDGKPSVRHHRLVRARAAEIWRIRGKRHAKIFSDARSEGLTYVVIDGVERSVPKLSTSSGSGSDYSSGSSSGSFSGGGGSSGGGGASGSW